MLKSKTTQQQKHNYHRSKINHWHNITVNPNGKCDYPLWKRKHPLLLAKKKR